MVIVHASSQKLAVICVFLLIVTLSGLSIPLASPPHPSKIQSGPSEAVRMTSSPHETRFVGFFVTVPPPRCLRSAKSSYRRVVFISTHIAARSIDPISINRADVSPCIYNRTNRRAARIIAGLPVMRACVATKPPLLAKALNNGGVLILPSPG